MATSPLRARCCSGWATQLHAGGSQITLERSFKGRHEVLSVDATCEPIFTAVTPPQRAHAAAQPQQAPIHNLVVATKSHDVVRAVRSVLHRLTPESNLLLVQNGLLAVFQVRARALAPGGQTMGQHQAGDARTRAEQSIDPSATPLVPFLDPDPTGAPARGAA